MKKILRFGARQVRHAKTIVKKRPLLAVSLTLAIFLGLMFLGKFLRQPAAVSEAETQPLPVQTFIIGTAPKITVQAEVVKESVVEILAQTSGVVSNINVKEGETVNRGRTLITINTTYTGGNALSLQRQIAQKQKETAETSYPDQIRLIELQRQQAEDTATSAEELREINAKAIDDTRGLISLNEEVVSTLNQNLTQFVATNSAGSNDTAILTTRQLLSQYRSALASLQNTLRTGDHQTDPDKIPSNQPELVKEITLANLRVQEKATTLSKELAELNYQLAALTERLTAPGAPLTAIVERVHVRPNQIVNPGTVLITLSGTDTSIVFAEAFVSQSLARAVSANLATDLTINSTRWELYPQFVSSEAVENQLFLIKFILPEDAINQVTAGQHLSLNLPLKTSDTSAAVPFIPLDSIYQSQSQAFVYVFEDGQAQVRTVTLGPVNGGFVSVESGLNSGDTVIMDRNVISGQNVTQK